MIPRPVLKYLQDHDVRFDHHRHPFAITAQEVAHAAHVSGFRLAKTVVLAVDGQQCLAVIPAPYRVDTDRLEELLGVNEVRLLREEEFVDSFPGCETGAEPPFGGLFGLSVLMDESLREQGRLAFHDGTHDALLELSMEDFERLEAPFVARFAYLPERRPDMVQAELPLPG